MLVRSTRLGELEVAETQVIEFPYGLPGFLDEKKFALLPCEEGNPFTFLQSMSEPNLTFVTVEPFVFFSDYEFSLADGIAEELGISTDNPPHVLNIVSIPENPEEMTANLLAPLVINTQERVAVQFVLEKTAYTTRHRLFPEGFDKPTAEGGR